MKYIIPINGKKMFPPSRAGVRGSSPGIPQFRTQELSYVKARDHVSHRSLGHPAAARDFPLLASHEMSVTRVGRLSLMDDHQSMNPGGILHILKTGARWRDVPPQYGPAKNDL